MRTHASRNPLILTFVALVTLQLCACGSTHSPAQTQITAKTPSPTPTTPPQTHPSSGGINGESNFARLMNAFPQGRTQRAPWVGYWWPYAEGGVSGSATLYEQASRKSGAVSWEASHHGPRAEGIQPWWGHCNGWAAAAALFREPLSAALQNGVLFTVSDQKALLSEIAMEVDADFFGQRDDSDDPNNLTFQDVFPDQFFLVLTNYVGNGLQLVMDRYTGSQVWNQPIAGYVHAPVTPADVLPPDPAAPGVTRVNVTTQVWWSRDDVAPDAITGKFNYQDDDSFQSRVLRYEVWLDGPVLFDGSGRLLSSGDVLLTKNGKFVTGGVWKNGDLELANSHPDYLWAPHRVAPSSGFSNPDVDSTWVGSRFGG